MSTGDLGDQGPGLGAIRVPDLEADLALGLLDRAQTQGLDRGQGRGHDHGGGGRVPGPIVGGLGRERDLGPDLVLEAEEVSEGGPLRIHRNRDRIRGVDQGLVRGGGQGRDQGPRGGGGGGEEVRDPNLGIPGVASPLLDQKVLLGLDLFQSLSHRRK